MRQVQFYIEGSTPLVMNRVVDEPRVTLEHPAVKPTDEEIFESHKYYGETDGERWEGFPSVSVRRVLMSASREYRLSTMATIKQAVLFVADGYEIREPRIPLTRIDGTSEIQNLSVRNLRGLIKVILPIYKHWSATINLKFDPDMISDVDLKKLLVVGGECAGLGEGRPDSSRCGLGWGTFKVVNSVTETP